tara:strand:- start:60 stop:446 length:387 start_codon:yes stop_codon:yes gene_type:complete
MPQDSFIPCQDLNVVVLRGKGSHLKTKSQREGNTTTEKKFDRDNSDKMRKLEEETEKLKVERVNPKISQAIISGRTAKKWKRTDLALKTQLSVSVITEYETGKAIPNINQIKKIERALGVKLTGKEFK